ncbi:MAG: ribulose-phosphate 3-epimerase [Bacillota bacterium]
MAKIAPSILSADFSRLGKDVMNITLAGADYLHVDIMDGTFVPNISFGMKTVADIKPYSHIPFDVHLMIQNPRKYFAEFVKAGADFITFHIEAEPNAKEAIQEIKALGIKAGIVISPDTSVDAIKDVLDICDMVLVMSVYPGFGGQSFIENSLVKVTELFKLRTANKYSYLIEIDGGINKETAKLARIAGADILVAGSAVFGAENWGEAMESMRR